MYALSSIALFLIGTALLVLVLVRKMPALVDLPDNRRAAVASFVSRIRQRIARVDWQRWQRFALTALAVATLNAWRFFLSVARGSERLTQRFRTRIMRLSGEEGLRRGQFSFFARIRRRSAYVQEERRLIEQLTLNPKDVDAYRRLGNLYIIAGNTSDAKAAFNEVLRLAPDDAEAARRLAELHT